MRKLAIAVCSVAVLAVAYGGVNLWRAAGQLGQASSLVGRADSRPSPGSGGADSGAASGGIDFSSGAVGETDEPAFDEPGPGDTFPTALPIDGPYETDLSHDFSGGDDPAAYEEEYREFSDPGLPLQYAEGLASGEEYVSEPYEEPPADEPYIEEDGAFDESFTHDGASRGDASDPRVVLQVLLNDPDPAVRDEAARALEEIERDRIMRPLAR